MQSSANHGFEADRGDRENGVTRNEMMPRNLGGVENKGLGRETASNEREIREIRVLSPPELKNGPHGLF